VQIKDFLVKISEAEQREGLAEFGSQLDILLD
jgi:hypothetical protein